MSEDFDEKTQILRRSPLLGAQEVPFATLQCVDSSVLKDGLGAHIELDGETMTVGRDATNKVSLQAQGVSRFHAKVSCDNGAWTVEDLGSTNGTRVNNSILDSKQALRDGDTVAFGRACYKFQLLTSDNVGGESSIDIDLGGNETTELPGPVELPASAAVGAEPSAPTEATSTSSTTQATTQVTSQAPPQATAQPATRRTTQTTGPRPTASTRPATTRAAPAHSSKAARKAESSNTVLWIVVLLAFAGLVFAAATLLGFI